MLLTQINFSAITFQLIIILPTSVTVAAVLHECTALYTKMLIQHNSILGWKLAKWLPNKTKNNGLCQQWPSAYMLHNLNTTVSHAPLNFHANLSHAHAFRPGPQTEKVSDILNAVVRITKSAQYSASGHARAENVESASCFSHPLVPVSVHAQRRKSPSLSSSPGWSQHTSQLLL